ncbi:MAG: CheR family methyltransferase [Xanthomonadaceae bacterium]|nr:CheR family methyltransferase [Xanthomonadaceae bacterium]
METQPTKERDFEFTGRDFRRVCDIIHRVAGIALAPSKQEMVYSRLARRLRALGLNSFQAYLDTLERDGGEEWQHFTNALTTNLTSFFRESHHFEVLAKHLRDWRGPPITMWCSAASTGEEPYSMAIVACEVFDTLTPPVRIVATDVDTQVLETASNAIYAMDRIEGLSAERKKRFFQRGSGPSAGFCRVRPALRDLITFRRLNLLDTDYGLKGPFTAIFCRNVMIYFDKPTQLTVLQRMQPLLDREGLFFAGHSESFFHATDLIRPVGRTVYRRSDSRGIPK